MKLSEFDFELPKALIAQEPVEPRDHAKLLVVWKNERRIEHRFFYDLLDYFDAGDVLVLNNTKVLPAKINARKGTGGKVEILLLRKVTDETWEAIVRGKVHGQAVVHAGEFEIKLSSAGDRWLCMGKMDEIIARYGRTPLPPYIKKDVALEKYQTVYAMVDGSVAAPTAGLHFTEELLARLKDKGVHIVYITLHVGYGTFHMPSCEHVEEHRMEGEYFSISQESATLINEAHKRGKRICCVGTTTMRALESASENYKVKPGNGYTELFIYPGYTFKSPVNAFITNFHVPKSTPLMLTAAFLGKERLFEVYSVAISQGYRFFSFGDAMIILA